MPKSALIQYRNDGRFTASDGGCAVNRRLGYSGNIENS